MATPPPVGGDHVMLTIPPVAEAASENGGPGAVSSGSRAKLMPEVVAPPVTPIGVPLVVTKVLEQNPPGQGTLL